MYFIPLISADEAIGFLFLNLYEIAIFANSKKKNKRWL